jgi:hypothetical protein
LPSREIFLIALTTDKVAKPNSVLFNAQTDLFVSGTTRNFVHNNKLEINKIHYSILFVAFGEFLRIVMIKQTQIPFKLFAAQQIFF